jgi:hypothetical protein
VNSEVLLWHCDAFSRSQQWSLWNAATLDQETTILAVEADRATPRLDSLFCIALCGPIGEDGGDSSAALLTEMERTDAGIFACEEFAVYSNPAINLGSYRTRLLDVDLAPLARKDGLGETSLVYQQLWDHIVAEGRYAFHSWTVKVAPDAVFLPARLREALRGPELQEPQSGNGLYLQSCERALGLHGALEVLSRRALEAFVEGRGRCRENEASDGDGGILEEFPREEASFLQSCLLRLGAMRVEHFGMLASHACGTERWSECTARAAVFHPFDSVNTLRQCAAAASREEERRD